MRTPIASENAILAKNGVEWIPVGFRLQVKDHLGAWQIYDVEAIKGSIRNSVDQPALSFSGEIIYRGLDATNLSPLYSSPKPIDLLREFRLEAGYLSGVGSVLKWHLLIEGRIDEIDLPDRYRMQLSGQSLMGHLNRLWVQQPDTIGTDAGRRSDLVIQDILTEWGGGVSLYVPSIPSDYIKTTKIDPQPVAKAVRDIALRIGWDVIDKWDEAAGQWRLTLWDPGRSNTTSLFTFSPSQYLDITAFALKASRIRNALEVPYGSGSSRGIARVDRTNNADCLQSYNDYGVEIFVNFGEDKILRFEDASQANAFLTAAASDLAQPPLVASWEVGFFPFVELGDIYTFQANNVQHSADQKLAVVGYEHTFNGVGGRTTLYTRGKPAGGVYRWAPPAAPDNPNGPGDASAPSPPTNLSGSFSGPDANLKWDQPTETGLEVEVKVFSSSVLRRTERILGNAYAYTLQKNRDDHGGSPSPALSFEVRFVRVTESGAENLSAPASLTLSNPAPSAPTGLTLTGQPLYFLVSVNDPALSDYLRTEVEADDNASFTSPTLAHAGPDWRGIRVGLESTSDTTYVRVRFVDVFGQASPWTSSNSNGVLVGGSYIAAQAIDVAKFASGIRPVQIVSSLPALPDANYPEGAVVFLTTDDKLYRSTGSGWTASVPTTDLSGQITTTQISDNAISTPKLAAGAVTTAKLAAGAVTANELAANSVVAGKVAAGAISTNELAAKAVTIEKLAIADWSNLISNPLADGSSAGWSGVSIVVDTGSGYNYAAEQSDRDAYFRYAFADAIPCEAGKHYWVSVRAINASASSYPFNVGLMFRDNTGAVISWNAAATFSVGTASWTEKGGVIQAPSNAVRMSFWTQINKPAGTETNKRWRFTNPVLRRAYAGELIVDGTITANKLTALELNAITGTFGGGANKTGIDNKGVRVYDSTNTLAVAMGDIGGLQWGSGSLATGTYGFWAKGGGLYLTDYPRLLGIQLYSATINVGTLGAGGEANVFTNGLEYNQTIAISAGRRLFALPALREYSVTENGSRTGKVILNGYVLIVEGWTGSTWENINFYSPSSNVSYSKWRIRVTNVIVRNVTNASVSNIDVNVMFLVGLYDSP